jgi:hypothetical protein
MTASSPPLGTKVDDFLAQKRIAVAGVSRDFGHRCMRAIMKLTGGLPT